MGASARVQNCSINYSSCESDIGHTTALKELAKEFEGTLDTALWRLRGAIEPDPKDPLYVVTRRGQGVRLENV